MNHDQQMRAALITSLTKQVIELEKEKASESERRKLLADRPDVTKDPVLRAAVKKMAPEVLAWFLGTFPAVSESRERKAMRAAMDAKMGLRAPSPVRLEGSRLVLPVLLPAEAKSILAARAKAGG